MIGFHVTRLHGPSSDTSVTHSNGRSSQCIPDMSLPEMPNLKAENCKPPHK